ncbi:MAG TPA: peptidoglycan-associated lipoprotein Pal [Burkholderiales bacterium]
MTEQSVFSSYRRISLILICMLLGACATTQRSSSGAGEQAAAPVSEAAKPAQTAAPQTPAPAAASTPSAAPEATPTTSTDSTDTSAEQSAPKSGASDEAAELKSQLANQDAQISKLREEQKADAERVDMAEQQKAAQAEEQQQQQAAAAEMPAAPVAATKPDEKIAVFPQDANAGARASETAPQSTAGSPIERSVYFAFDQSKIAEKYDDMLMANAAWLKAHPQMKAEVQGNCDERGSREYNLALGSRRAHAVKRALEVAGADGTRIATVSFGAEKPIAPGKDEASYSRNRRADIVY